MKRLVVLAGIWAVVMAISSTQTQAMSWEMGFRGGVSISHFMGADKDSLGADLNPGVSGGLWVKSNITRNFGVRIEGTYVRKGAREKLTGRRQIQNTIVSADFKVWHTLDYIEVPVLVVVTTTNETASTRLGVYFGPALAFNVGANQKIQSGALEIKSDFSDYVKSTEIGVMVGAESGFRIGENTLLTLDLRWTYDWNSFDDSGLNLDIKNSAFQLMMGVALPLGGIIAPPPPKPEPQRR